MQRQGERGEAEVNVINLRLLHNSPLSTLRQYDDRVAFSLSIISVFSVFSVVN